MGVGCRGAGGIGGHPVAGLQPDNAAHHRIGRGAVGVARPGSTAHSAQRGAPARHTRRRAGALAPGQFGWLKLVDRRLWYALHLLGFETEGAGRYLHPNPRVEALGARDHWSVERIAGVPVSRPDLDRAVEALQKAALARLSGAGN